MILTIADSCIETCKWSGLLVLVVPKIKQLGEYLSSGYSSITIAHHHLPSIKRIILLAATQSDPVRSRSDRLPISIFLNSQFLSLWSGPFAEDVDADVGEVEGDSGGEGGVYWEGEAGEVD